MDSILSRDIVGRMLRGDGSYSGPAASTLKTLASDSDLYLRMETVLDHRLTEAAHSFTLTKMETVSAPVNRAAEFKRRLSAMYNPNLHFLFHGTKECNHESIFNKGFLIDEEHWGDTDAGFIGRGVYLSPHPEYCASYIKETNGISHFAYENPVKVGITVKILGCVALVGSTKRLYEATSHYGVDIPSGLDSHWAWVKTNGVPTGNERDQFAMEYTIKEPENIYARFRLSLKRVTREVIWVDPNITNTENSSHVRRLKNNDDASLFATSSSAEALAALKRKKQDTEYRAVTAGQDGEDFVKKLRAAGIHCKVLVFCNAVDWHRQWARKFSNIEVTRSAERMIQFATWK